MIFDVTLDNFQKAASQLKKVINNKKIIKSEALSKLSKNTIYLKPENLQKTGSFKIRGAYNKIINLSDDERKKGVIASSAGNHAQGVAYSASAYGVKSTIVMPVGAPISKVVATKGYGADVILHGDFYDDAYIRAIEIMKETGMTFIHPFNDIDVIIGQGTIGLEIIDELPEVDVIVVPIGGGGLISGIAAAVKLSNPKIKIIGVEPYLAASMSTSINNGQITTLKNANTIADGIAVKTPGKLTYEFVKEFVDDIVTVSDGEIAEAVLMLLEKKKLVSEGAGAASLAAVINRKIKVKNKNIACLISGGNIDMSIVSNIIEKGLLQSGRKYELKVTLSDKPGQLQHLLELIAKTKANISSIQQTKIKSYVKIGCQEVTMILDTKNHEHIRYINNLLNSYDYEIIN